MTADVRASYRHCERVAKLSAKNFYYGFRLLPERKRLALCAVYAFMRLADDMADESACTSSGTEALDRWSGALASIYSGAVPDHPSLPAFHDAVHRYQLPRRLFEELIEGVRMDLVPARYATFLELERYCYRVAGVVGLICIRIWGVSDFARATPLAEQCGTAFQLTNILRDVREDAARGRLYVPMEPLARFGVTESDIQRHDTAARVQALIEFEADRAARLYDCCRDLAALIEPDSRAAFLAMYLVYRALLDRISASPTSVMRGRVGLTVAAKVGAVSKALRLARLRDPLGRD
ncbi:MAG: phytoene/squalene synthase family protein [Armatimonadetes bacterium]|nr:phytoene/squalene synthase family protein [Armatimonadota bacterium]